MSGPYVFVPKFIDKVDLAPNEEYQWPEETLVDIGENGEGTLVTCTRCTKSICLGRCYEHSGHKACNFCSGRNIAQK